MLLLLVDFSAPFPLLRLCLLRRLFTVDIFPNLQIFQVFPCLRPILGLLRHLHQCAKQALEDILRDMHLIKAMRRVVIGPVLQVPENRPRFPYLQQRLRCLFDLSRRRALFLVSQQLVDFSAAPLTCRSSKLSQPIE